MMKRRDFFAASCLAGMAPLAATAEGTSGSGGKQLLELRLFKIANMQKQQVVLDFLSRAAIPALNRIGVKPVGVFRQLAADNEKLQMEADSPDLYVLSAHNSFESFAGTMGKLAEDDEFLAAGGDFFDAPKDDPAYLRMESSLMLAFDAFPRVEVPTQAKTRLFQLRTYESHSVKKGQLKVHMFNEGGEIRVFRECGMTPVFFGKTLAGAKMPNLTYMLGFNNAEAQAAAWDKFKAHPDWKALRSMEMYKGTVSNITNIVLRPAACSQI